MSWKATDLLPSADNFYSQVEHILGQSIRRHHNIVKIFNSIEDENNWMVKKNSAAYKEYFGDVKKISIPEVSTPFGVGIVNSIGHLDTNLYLNLSKNFFKDNGIHFVEESFDHNSIEDQTYRQFEFSRIIFCEGFGLKQNPFFNYLPLNGTHGDTLIIKTKSYNFDGVLNKNMYVLPLGDHKYKLGASINWEKKEAEITEAGKNVLLERLRGFAQFNFEIVGQQAGIRPTVIDRRPLLGTHYKHTELVVFNGLGTKGVMLAPYFSHHLIEHLFEDKPINDEVNITRFEKYLH